MAKFLLLLLPLLALAHTAMGDEALRRMSILNRLMRRRDDFWLEQSRSSGPNADCGKFEIFDQKADHFNQSDTATFKQHYQANFKYHSNTTGLSIVFLMIGGEGLINAKWVCNEAVSMMKLAKEHGAIAVQLEHRFFGGKSDAGLGDLSTANMQRLLTLDQALADIAAFVPFFNRLHGLRDARWVAFGGSYSGSMAAWLRVKYPDLTVGSVASSAPIWPKVDFWEYSAKMEYAIRETSKECYEDVKNAFGELTKMLLDDMAKVKLDQLYQAKPKFSTLAPIDVTMFLSSVFGAWQGIVQYTYDQPYHALDNLTMACQLMTNAKSLQEGLRDVFKLVKDEECARAQITPEKCAINDFTYANAIQPYKDTSLESSSAASRAWMWMTCNEFGWYQTTDKENGIFGDILSMNFFYKQCADLFGTVIGAEYVESRVAGSLKKWGDGCTFNGTNVVLPNGRFDPWSMLGVHSGANCQKDNAEEEADKARHLVALWTDGAAHCADMYPAYEGEPKGLALTRQKVADQVKYYLAQNGASGYGLSVWPMAVMLLAVLLPALRVFN